MKTSLDRLLLTTVVVATAGCASAPLSLLVGEPKTKTELLLFPVKIVSVDGGIEFRNPVQVAPGPRWLVLEAGPSAGARTKVQKSFVLRVEPCTRYFLAARRASAVAAEWEVVIDAKEPVSGCDAEAEMRKAAPTSKSTLSTSLRAAS